MLPGIDLMPVDLHLQDVDGFCALRLPNGRLVEGSAMHLLSELHAAVLQDLRQGEPGAPLVHGASIIVNDRRVLLVGHKGCGKTTLSLHLATHGCRVEGDEQLVVREQEVIARPRKMRVKPGALSLVSGLPASIWDAPVLENWDGTPIRAVSPAIGGLEWTITPGPLAVMIFLVANHNGRSVAKPLPPDEAFRRLMGETLMPLNGVAAAAGRLRRLAFETPCFELLLGDLILAEWHINKIAALLTTP